MPGKPKDPNKQYSPNYGGTRTPGPGKSLGRGKKLDNPVRVSLWIEADELEFIKQHGKVTDVIRQLIREFMETQP